MKKLFLASSFAMLIGAAHAQGITRDELKRADLTGKDMDVIVTVVTVRPEKIFRNISTRAKKSFTYSTVRRLSYRTEARGHSLLGQRQSILVTYPTPDSRLQATRR